MDSQIELYPHNQTAYDKLYGRMHIKVGCIRLFLF